MAHRAPVKGGYFPVPPTDTLQDIRNAMCLALEQQGVEVEVHHHELGAMGQNEIGTRFAPLVQRADWMQILKYTVWNVAASYGKTATFMPKPVVGDNGSGMHVHQSVWKGGNNLFAGTVRGPLRVRAALHRRDHPARQALNAITNPAPTRTSCWCRLRGADQSSPTREEPLGSCRIPTCRPEGRRSEVRFPDPTANSYSLSRRCSWRAGRRCTQDPSRDPIDKDMYHCRRRKRQGAAVCASLEEALEC